jgi:tetratricopeptide (TPR) repeat protein
MRGTDDEVLFDRFVAAVLGFPPTARDGKSAKSVFKESYQILSDLADAKTPFPRAIAWKAYALALSVYEGWPLPDGAAEEGMDSQQRLDLARDLGRAAIGHDHTDFDLHWAMADIHLIRKEFPQAKEEFERAVYLNRDERHPSLFAEAGSAMMQIGELERAQMYFRRAMRRPDWHHWMRGILLFVKAGRAGAEEETFLNLALDELKGTYAQLGDDFYQTEVQLVLACVHWRKSRLFAQRAANLPDGVARALIQRDAERNRAAAEREIRQFRAVFDHWTVEQALTAVPFDDANDENYWETTVRELWEIPLNPPSGNSLSSNP